jgi:hypothetical protein
VFAALLLLSGPVHAAHFCIEPDFFPAATEAQVIFSGKITKVERSQSYPEALGEYVVTFKVDRWWKGMQQAGDTRVLWRTTFMDCPTLAVGEVGDEYLVYGEPARSTVRQYQMPEVTVFSRTARLPASRKAEMIIKNGFTQAPLMSRTPPLNRTDASNDVELLIALRDCSCMPPPGKSESDLEQIVSSCRVCLRRRLKPSF